MLHSKLLCSLLCTSHNDDSHSAWYLQNVFFSFFSCVCIIIILIIIILYWYLVQKQIQNWPAKASLGLKGRADRQQTTGIHLPRTTLVQIHFFFLSRIHANIRRACTAVHEEEKTLIVIHITSPSLTWVDHSYMQWQKYNNRSPSYFRGKEKKF